MPDWWQFDAERREQEAKAKRASDRASAELVAATKIGAAFGPLTHVEGHPWIPPAPYDYAGAKCPASAEKGNTPMVTHKEREERAERHAGASAEAALDTAWLWLDKAAEALATAAPKLAFEAACLCEAVIVLRERLQKAA